MVLDRDKLKKLLGYMSIKATETYSYLRDSSFSTLVGMLSILNLGTVLGTTVLWLRMRILQVKDINEIKWWAIQDLNL